MHLFAELMALVKAPVPPAHNRIAIKCHDCPENDKRMGSSFLSFAPHLHIRFDNDFSTLLLDH
jgi:hypothetical protein